MISGQDLFIQTLNENKIVIPSEISQQFLQNEEIQRLVRNKIFLFLKEEHQSSCEGCRTSLQLYGFCSIPFELTSCIWIFRKQHKLFLNSLIQKSSATQKIDFFMFLIWEKETSDLINTFLEDPEVLHSEKMPRAFEIACENNHKIMTRLLKIEKIKAKLDLKKALISASSGGCIEAMKMLLEDETLDPTFDNFEVYRTAKDPEIKKLLREAFQKRVDKKEKECVIS